MEILRGCRVRVVGIPGGTPKIEEKQGFSGGGSMQKNGKFQGCHGKFDWKSRGVNSRKSISSTEGYNFFLEKPNENKTPKLHFKF